MNEELRERCINTLMRGREERLDTRELYTIREGAEADLDALLDLEGTCKTCKGTGYDPKRMEPLPPGGDCPSCGGSGSDGTPAVVGMLMEQVGMATDQDGVPVFSTEDGRRTKGRLYVVRPDTEGEA